MNKTISKKNFLKYVFLVFLTGCAGEYEISTPNEIKKEPKQETPIDSNSGVQASSEIKENKIEEPEYEIETKEEEIDLKELYDLDNKNDELTNTEIQFSLEFNENKTNLDQHETILKNIKNTLNKYKNISISIYPGLGEKNEISIKRKRNILNYFKEELPKKTIRIKVKKEKDNSTQKGLVIISLSN